MSRFGNHIKALEDRALRRRVADAQKKDRDMLSLRGITPRRIHVCTPVVGDDVGTEFHMSLLNAMLTTMAQQDPAIEWVKTDILGSSILPAGRLGLAKRAIDAGATHILWIDADMAVPPGVLLHMSRHTAGIVAANCIGRRPPHAYTARAQDGTQIKTLKSSRGLESAWRVGTGVMWMDVNVLVGTPFPWFPFEWDEAFQGFKGEDYWLCDLARSKGFEVFVDHDVSKVIRHMGQFAYHPLIKEGVEDAAEIGMAQERAVAAARMADKQTTEQSEGGASEVQGSTDAA